MKCKKVEKWLPGYLRDELTAGQHREIHNHLKDCDRCRIQLKRWERFQEQIATLPGEIEPERDLWPGISEQISSTPQIKKEPVVRVTAKTRIPLIAAVTAVILFGAVSLMYTIFDQQTSDWRFQTHRGPEKTGTDNFVSGHLTVGGWLETDDISRATVEIGDLGVIEVDPHTRIRLLKNEHDEQRMQLAIGRIEALIFAPPRLFFVETPAAVAVDLGCEYELAVNPEGDGMLHVISGWVELQRSEKFVTVPGGGMCEMNKDLGPGIPYYEKTSETVKNLISEYSFGNPSADQFSTLLQKATKNDLLSLSYIVEKTGGGQREELIELIVSHRPLPSNITAGNLLQLDADALALWRNDLQRIWLQP